jgi:hypothetical protein
MSMTDVRLTIPLSLLGCLFALPAAADAPFSFSTGTPDGKMATATRPESTGKLEIESADDFILTTTTQIDSATFTGLLPPGASASDVKDVVVEIYRVFPKDSNVGRTSGPNTTPPFSTPEVPTRLNSPSDVEFTDRDSASGNLSFMTSVGAPFTAANSVQPGGINPKPGQTTGGDGSVTGEETVFGITFTTPFRLPADHYFFVPQVQLDDGDFLWLSAPKPITGGTGAFLGDLQSWTRDAMLEPDWLRVGQDIVGGTPFPTFNATFSLSGSTVPEPSTWAMMLLGFAGLGYAGYRRARRLKPAHA